MVFISAHNYLVSDQEILRSQAAVMSIFCICENTVLNNITAI